MRETLANRTLTYGLLGLFVLMVAVPLFWMVTTALKTEQGSLRGLHATSRAGPPSSTSSASSSGTSS